MAAGDSDMQAAAQPRDDSSSRTALDEEQPQQQQEQQHEQGAVDPDGTEDEMEAEGEADQSAATAPAAAAKRAPPRRRKKSAGWGNSKKPTKKSPLTWQERAARAAANKAAAAAAKAEADQSTQAAQAEAPQHASAAAAPVAAEEPTVKVEAMEAEEKQAASELATAADEVVEKTERGRPLRASIKARQKQLEEERRQEEESRKRRREEKLLAQTRSRTRVKKEEPTTITPLTPHHATAQHPPPPPSSLSSLPSSSSHSLSSSSYVPGPPPPPALVSGERDKSRVVPSHCYGVDWRCVAKLTDCIYAQLQSTRSSVIDWSVVSAMMANVSPLTANECRLLWRCAAYGMDEDGYGRWKRLDPQYEDEADSDIDVDLPGGDEAGVADCRTILKSSQFRQCAKEDTTDGWTTQHDAALLDVLAIWSSKSRQQHQLPTPTPPPPPPRITLSLTTPPLSTTALPHLPATVSDWQYVADLFQHYAALHRSPAFLQARFAALARTALTLAGGDGDGRAGMGQRVLAVLGVGQGVEGREWLLHSGGRNWDEKRTIADRRRRLRGRQQANGRGDASGQKQPKLSVSHTPAKAAPQQHEAEAQQDQLAVDADSVAAAQSRGAVADSSDAVVEEAAAEPAQAVTAESGVSGDGAVPMLTEGAVVAAQ